MIKVVVVEDNDTIREGLKVLIDGTKGYSCPAAYSECKELLNNIQDLNPDILLIDIGLPGMNGIEGIRQVKAIMTNLLILVLTVYEENDLIFNALCAGASGFIVKKTPPSRLLQTIKEAHHGYASMNSKVAGKVIKLFQQKKSVNNGNSNGIELSLREGDILNKLMEGSSVKAIADSLSIGMETLGSDFRNIFKKLHLYSKSQNNSGR